MKVFFTPNSRSLFVNDNTSEKIVQWHLATGQKTNSIDALWLAALAPDGERGIITSSSQTALPLWNLKTGQRLYPEFGHTKHVTNIAISPDFKTLVTTVFRQKEGLLWDTTSARPHPFPPGLKFPEVDHGQFRPAMVQSLFFSPDGSQIGVSINYSPSVRIVGTTTSKPAHIHVPDAEGVLQASFSADGRQVYALAWKKAKHLFAFHVHHLDAATGKQLKSWPLPHAESIPLLAPDGRTVIAQRGEGEPSAVYDVALGRAIYTGAQFEEAWGSCFSPDGRLIATCFEGRLLVKVWEPITGNAVLTTPDGNLRTTDVAWSPDGRLFATSDQALVKSDDASIRLWDVATGKPLARFQGMTSCATALCFSADATCLVAGMSDGTILIYEIGEFDPRPKTPPVLGNAELEALWADLGSLDAARAHRAGWTLVDSARQAAAYLRGQVKPVTQVDAAALRKLLAELDSDTFAVRVAANEELKILGERAEQGVREALQGNAPLETRRRLKQLLEDPPGPTIIRSLRAIAVLERIGAPEAALVLETLAKGAPGVRTTVDAAAALERVRAKSIRR
jgi:WD40 repeat protein